MDFKEILVEHPESISRKDIAEFVKNAIAGQGSNRKVFIATMIWGYGTVGYGAWRTSKMLAAERSQEMIEKSFNLVLDGKYIEAYEIFSLPRCGHTFLTKYLYFVGLGVNAKPMPLILDSVVANSLELLGLDSSRYAIVARNKVGQITAVSKWSTGYFRYVEMVNNWASELDCRPDAIEKWMFSL